MCVCYVYCIGLSLRTPACRSRVGTELRRVYTTQPCRPCVHITSQYLKKNVPPRSKVGEILQLLNHFYLTFKVVLHFEILSEVKISFIQFHLDEVFWFWLLFFICSRFSTIEEPRRYSYAKHRVYGVIEIWCKIFICTFYEFWKKLSLRKVPARASLFYKTLRFSYEIINARGSLNVNNKYMDRCFSDHIRKKIICNADTLRNMNFNERDGQVFKHCTCVVLYSSSTV